MTRDVHWCVTVFYQQIENSNIANQIHGFTIDYDKFILMFNSARPRKMPGWIVLVQENFSVNKRVWRKQTIEIVLRRLSVFFFKFYIWLSRLLSQNFENNSIEV